MNLQTVIQSHPSRAELLPRLLADLPDAQVVYDPEPDNPIRSPWRCYLACLEAAAASGTDSTLVLQDDALLCHDFLATVHNVIAARPESMIDLFIPGTDLGGRQVVLKACYAGKNWARLDRAHFVPVVALIWPRADVKALLAYVEAKPFPLKRWCDDANVAQFCRATRREVWATVPSLVEHDDFTPSVIGAAHTNGRNPTRIAACWAGREEWSPIELDWAT